MIKSLINQHRTGAEKVAEIGRFWFEDDDIHIHLSWCTIKSLINQPGTGAEKVAKIGMFLGHHQAAV